MLMKKRIGTPTLWQNLIKEIAMRKSICVLTFLFFSSSAFAQPARESDQLLEAGPMLGYVEMQEANLWIQTKRPAAFEIKYWPEGEQSTLKYTYKDTTEREVSNTAHIKLKNLDYGTTYKYDVYVEGDKISLPYRSQFTTQPLWQWRTEAPDVSIAVGSCLYVNDPEYDRPGDPYGQGMNILNEIYEQNPDIMLWLGDNLYYREPDFYSRARMDYRYKDARNTPEMQPLLAGAINLATWDDHDYGPNNSDRSYRMREEALEIFKRYWVNPGYGIEGTNGVFSRYKYGDVEFFFMDDRYHRAPNNLRKKDKDFFGEAQLQWLMDGLVGSYATFKIVVVGNQVTNKMNKYESLYAYGKEYERLMKFLNQHDVRGVLFVSGDRHFTELLKTERRNNYPIYEFTSSPLSSGSYENLDESDEFENSQRVDGTLVYKDQNFGMIRVTGKEGERKLILQTYRADGKKLWERKISEKELQK